MKPPSEKKFLRSPANSIIVATGMKWRNAAATNVRGFLRRWKSRHGAQVRAYGRSSKMRRRG
jgi:hypothetical protein